MRRTFDERGQAGGFEVLAFGMLIFVAGTLLVANAWAVIDAKIAVSAAAREAARVYVEAPAATAAADAEDAGREAVAGQGRDPQRLGLEIDGEVVRCAPITVRTSYEIPAIKLPWIDGFGEGITVRARHTEIVDPFRSGLPGEADCSDASG